eukprot:2591849-Ditylum_brightwellii.AAC.1
MQQQRLPTLSNAKLRIRLDKDSDLLLDEIGKPDTEPEHFMDLVSTENKHEEYSLKMFIVLIINMMITLSLVFKGKIR